MFFYILNFHVEIDLMLNQTLLGGGVGGGGKGVLITGELITGGGIHGRDFLFCRIRLFSFYFLFFRNKIQNRTAFSCLHISIDIETELKCGLELQNRHNCENYRI